MTYASGGLIQATDFNTRVSSVNQLWGTGSGNYGYGQSTTVGTNSAGSVVPASDWATLIARMTSMQQHQFNNTTGIPSQPTAGSIITYLSQVDTAITSLQNNRTTVYTNPTTAASVSTTNGTGWVTSSVKTFTFTFGSYDQARYFFNTGGILRMDFRFNTLSGNSKSDYWNAFLNNGLAIIDLRANSLATNGGGYQTNTFLSSSGFYNLNSTPTTFASYTDVPSAADYTLNTAVVQYSLSGAVITVTATLTDNAGQVFNDTVSGTTRIDASLIQSETTYISNTWGTPTIANTVNTQS